MQDVNFLVPFCCVLAHLSPVSPALCLYPVPNAVFVSIPGLSKPGSLTRDLFHGRNQQEVDICCLQTTCKNCSIPRGFSGNILVHCNLLLSLARGNRVAESVCTMKGQCVNGGVGLLEVARHHRACLQTTPCCN